MIDGLRTDNPFFQAEERIEPVCKVLLCSLYQKPFNTLTFPLGCPQMIFHRGTPLFIPELGKRQDQFTVSGQVNFPSHIATEGDTEMIVAVFFPHTIGLFTDTSPFEYYNREISGYDLGNKELSCLASRISESYGYEQSIIEIESYLLKKLQWSYDNDIKRISPGIAYLSDYPSATVERLAGISCLSKKQYERVFRRLVGMNPKEFAGIIKFQRTLWMLQNGNRNFADIAYSSGYADQSHFNREFRKYSGVTPGRLLSLQKVYSDFFNSTV